MGVRGQKSKTVREKSNLVLIGFMGTGKTSVGRDLARKLGMEMVDTDQEIEKAVGLPVADIFKRFGEIRFRSEEAIVVKRVSQLENCIIATGGGVVLQEENMRELSSGGYIVLLEARPEIISRRIQRKPRPLIDRNDSLPQIKKLLKEREAFYQGADLAVDTSDIPREMVVEQIAAWFARQRCSVVRVETGTEGYDIVIGENILSTLGSLVEERVSGKRCLLVSNQRVAGYYGEKARSSLNEAGFAVTTRLIPEGEEYKSLETAQELYSAAVEAGLDRDCAIIALGGGVIGDLAGFVAATFMRGVPLVQVPTTLLAQVDSSVGGKVAVNHPRGKNLIGAFYQPRLVVCDLTTLKTLEHREVRAGMAEVIKYGIIWDDKLFGLLEDRMGEALQLNPELLRVIITRCCEIKAEIVSRDEREHGVRTLLNFGHTVGHALEGETGYQVYRHGEAIAVGMEAAGRLAVLLGKWSEQDQERLSGLLAEAKLPQTATGMDVKELESWLERDKKMMGGRVRWVLPTGIGSADVVADVPQEMVEKVLTSIIR